ncbi:MAG: hypothetical protein JXX14_11490 [Deltaproteobacteria bacterium]|nr:hypothetical protein [Deltaproteobacteria bacterium]
MSTNPFPARIHVLLARSARRALVIRRGPSTHTCVIDWDRNTETFEVCQWFKGRLYERRSDISPDGKHWIYFAMNGKWQSETLGAWTTVARTPWLKAISLYAKGNCWNGGGLFLTNRTFWLNDGLGHSPLFESSHVHRNLNFHADQHYGAECPHVYYNRLQRDGWQLLNAEEVRQKVGRAVFERPITGDWTLRKICHEEFPSKKGRGGYWDSHELANRERTVEHTDWEWADWVDNSIIFAQNGCLYEQKISQAGDIGDCRMLHDFNPYTFERRIAPSIHPERYIASEQP